ncbi:hypothetical protein ACOME3_004035 [Neoechinorhynchus agilis]
MAPKVFAQRPVHQLHILKTGPSNRISADLKWAMIRNTSCFKVQSLGTVLTRERFNLLNKHTFRNSGLIHDQVIDINSKDGKSIAMTMRRKKGDRKMSSRDRQIVFRKGKKAAMKSVKNIMKNKPGYRRDLKSAALKRVQAIHLANVAMMAKKAQ